MQNLTKQKSLLLNSDFRTRRLRSLEPPVPESGAKAAIRESPLLGQIQTFVMPMLCRLWLRVRSSCCDSARQSSMTNVCIWSNSGDSRMAGFAPLSGTGGSSDRSLLVRKSVETLQAEAEKFIFEIKRPWLAPSLREVKRICSSNCTTRKKSPQTLKDSWRVPEGDCLRLRALPHRYRFRFSGPSCLVVPPYRL